MSEASWSAEWNPLGVQRVLLRSASPKRGKVYTAVRLEQENLFEAAAWCGLDIRTEKGWLHYLETRATPPKKIFIGWWIVKDSETWKFYAYDDAKFKRIFKKVGA